MHGAQCRGRRFRHASVGAAVKTMRLTLHLRSSSLRGDGPPGAGARWCARMTKIDRISAGRSAAMRRTAAGIALSIVAVGGMVGVASADTDRVVIEAYEGDRAPDADAALA